MVQVMVNSWSREPFYRNLGIKSVTREMHGVPTIVNSEHHSDRRIGMSIPQTLLTGFDFRGRDKEDKGLLRI